MPARHSSARLLPLNSAVIFQPFSHDFTAWKIPRGYPCGEIRCSSSLGQMRLTRPSSTYGEGITYTARNNSRNDVEARQWRCNNIDVITYATPLKLQLAQKFQYNYFLICRKKKGKISSYTINMARLRVKLNKLLYDSSDEPKKKTLYYFAY